MLEQETRCSPRNPDFARKDEEGAITELNNVRQNRYASVRYATAVHASVLYASVRYALLSLTNDPCGVS